MIEDAQFQREAYLSLADEMDPIGGPVEWIETDWDPTFVAAARRFAADRGLPFPMMDGIDAALVLVHEEEEK